MSADNSYQARLERLRNRTLAIFHSRNPTLRELGSTSMDESTRLNRQLGKIRLIIQPSEGPAYEVTPCCPSCTEPNPATVTISDSVDIRGDPYLGIYTIYYDITWDNFANATSYTYSTTCPDPYVFVSTGDTSVRLYVNWMTASDFSVTITGINACASASSSATTSLPCFLAGSRVSMGDGTIKAIEDVLVGDIVVGAFGERNTVLALHRPLLGTATMCHINKEHWSTSHHPHISADRKFYCMDPALTENSTYGRLHEVINSSNQKEMMLLRGLAPGRIQELSVGVILKTIDGGRVVSSLVKEYMSSDTQLYNLVVSGSHTYHVDGYAVTGWPREDDFDYDAWSQHQ